MLVMTVRELVTELLKCNLDAIVVMESQESWTNIETVHINNNDLVELLEDTNDREN